MIQNLAKNKIVIKLTEYSVVLVLAYFFIYRPIIRYLNEEKSSREVFEKNMASNLNALNDSVRVKMEKNGKVQYEKLGLVFTKIEELKMLDEELYKKLATQDEELKSYINSKVNIDLSNVKDNGDLSQLTDSTFILKTEFLYDSLGLSHKFSSSTDLFITNKNDSYFLQRGSSIIDKNLFSVDLEYKIVEDSEGKNRVIAYSKSPYVSFKSLNSIYIEKERNCASKRFGIGPSVGVMYNNNRLSAYVGLGVNLNLISLKSK